MRFSRLILVPSLLSAFLLTGCGDDDLPDYFLLDRLRIVAATTNTSAAEFSAGDAVNMTFHISDPKGGGRTLATSIIHCVDPGVNLGARPSCEGNPTATTPVTGNLAAGPAATNYYVTLAVPPFNLPPAAVMYLDPRTGSPRPAADQYNGVGYLVILTLTASPTETVTAFKRIVASTKPTKNQNPAFSTPSLLFAETNAGTYTLGATPFTVKDRMAAGSAESYSTQNSDGTLSSATESLTVSWLVTAGEMRLSRTDPGAENRYSPAIPLPPVTSFIAVLRDDRGGAAIVTLNKP